MTDRDLLYLRHILDSLERIDAHASFGRDISMSESHWQDAVTRQFEIVGEATKRLSPELRQQYPDIPWRWIAGLRDMLIHDHKGVDLEAVWALDPT